MATNDIWRVSVVGSHGGTELGIYTMHFRFKTNVATFAGLAAAVKTSWVDQFKSFQSTNFRTDSINGLKIQPLPKQSDTYVTGFPVAGTDGTEEMPHQVAIIASLKTAYAGRSYRGRHFLPATSEDRWDDGLVESVALGQIQGLYSNAVTAYGAGGTDPDYEWIVWSERLNAYNPITSAVVRAVPGTIRRRRIGVGQ